MSTPELPFLDGLTEQDRLHFRNLVLLRPQFPTEGQLRLVEGMARTLGAPRLLTLIARTPHWLAHGPILQALAENESTPEPIRRDLEMVVSLFDLMRDMDRAPVQEKAERAEVVKGVYQALAPGLKPIVKHQAKTLARHVTPTGFTQELPPLPAEEQDWEELTQPPIDEAPPQARLRASKEELLERAAATPVLEEVQAFLREEDADIRQGALHNPMVSEDLLVPSLQQSVLAEFFEEVYGEARWYFRDAIREAMASAPCCPEALARKMSHSRQLVFHLEHGARDPKALRTIVSLFTQLDESEYQFLTFWAKRHSPNILRVIKIFYDRLQRRRASQATGFTSPGHGNHWVSLEERVFMANQATQPDQIIAALRDPDPQVFLVVLENPGLTVRELLAAIAQMDQERAERLAQHRTWGDQAPVREALLHNVHLSRITALALLPGIRDPRALMDILRDPRIPHLDVKQQALETLAEVYGALEPQGRVLALRASGGELIRHLPQEVLKDEDTLHELINDRQLDPSILLRLARNKQTPRGVLAHIAAHPVLMAHPAIMSELLLNPKTPRESSIRIWGLLSESEQQQLLKSPHLPASLRNAN